MEKPGYVGNKHFTEYAGKVKALRRAGDDTAAEELLLKLTAAIEAESRVEGSGQGQSGSPVFVYLPGDRRPGIFTFPTGASPEESEINGWPRLLGIVIGHFSLEDDAVFRAEMGETGYTRRNSGIAIVVPAQVILDAIGSPEFMHRLDEALENQMSDRMVGSLGALGPDSLSTTLGPPCDRIPRLLARLLQRTSR